MGKKKRKQKRAKLTMSPVVPGFTVVPPPAWADQLLEVLPSALTQTPEQLVASAVKVVEDQTHHVQTCDRPDCLRRVAAALVEYRLQLDMVDELLAPLQVGTVQGALDQLEAALVERGVEVGSW